MHRLISNLQWAARERFNRAEREAAIEADRIREEGSKKSYAAALGVMDRMYGPYEKRAEELYSELHAQALEILQEEHEEAIAIVRQISAVAESADNHGSQCKVAS